MRKVNIIVCLLAVLCLFTACGRNEKREVQNSSPMVDAEQLHGKVSEAEAEEKSTSEQENSTELVAGKECAEESSYIAPQGITVESRILPPEGYERTEEENESLLEYLRSFPVKEDGSPVLLYDGSEKRNQDAHVAVMKLPVEDADLQQCADSIMRMYAEYFLASGQEERISFHFTNGFEADYTKWRDGYRIKVDGNQVSWIQSADYDDSYETFVKYMRMVFSYAGTLSMDTEAVPIATEEIQVGDVFLKGGSPGHVVMIVDVCENEDGKRAFLLAQGYMPAQEFHILKNPDSDTNPWYYEEDIEYPFVTPEYVFEEGSLQRLDY